MNKRIFMTEEPLNENGRNANTDYAELFMRFSEITQSYTSASSERQEEILRGLGKIIENPPVGQLDESDKVRSEYYIIAKSFNGKAARRFREQLGLARGDVARRCGANAQAIGQYEICPSLPKRATKNVVNYLAWLSSKGFNLSSR